MQIFQRSCPYIRFPSIIYLQKVSSWDAAHFLLHIRCQRSSADRDANAAFEGKYFWLSLHLAQQEAFHLQVMSDAWWSWIPPSEVCMNLIESLTFFFIPSRPALRAPRVSQLTIFPLISVWFSSSVAGVGRCEKLR